MKFHREQSKWWTRFGYQSLFTFCCFTLHSLKIKATSFFSPFTPDVLLLQGFSRVYLEHFFGGRGDEKSVHNGKSN